VIRAHSSSFENGMFNKANLQKKMKKKTFGCLVTFWFDTFVKPFSATGHVVSHENT